MQRLFTSLLIFVTLLLSMGNNGGIVQLFGWTRLLATYSRVMPAGDAVRLTFSKGVICGDEQIVESVRKELRDKPAISAAPDAKPVLLIPAFTEPLIAKPICTRRVPLESTVQGCGKTAPPIPPPRAAEPAFA